MARPWQPSPHFPPFGVTLPAVAILFIVMVLTLCAAGGTLGFGVGRGESRVLRAGILLAGCAWLMHATVFVFHYATVHRPALGPRGGGVPVGLWDHPMPSLGWLLLTASLGLAAARRPARPLLALIVPVVIALDLGGVLFSDRDTVAALLPETLRTRWFPVHAFTSFFGLIGLSVAAAASAFYLLQDWRLRRKMAPGPRLPSLESLDSVVRYAAVVGVAALAVGMVSGAFWAASAQQAADGLDIRPKIVATGVVWLAWAMIWPLRALLGWGGRRTSQVAILGFVLLLGSLFGVDHR